MRDCRTLLTMNNAIMYFTTFESPLFYQNIKFNDVVHKKCYV